MAQEKELVKYFAKASDLQFGLKKIEVVTFAYKFAKKLNIQYPPEWDRNLSASKDWYSGFMHRNPVLTLRTPEQISLNHAKAFSPEGSTLFFDNFCQSAFFCNTVEKIE